MKTKTWLAIIGWLAAGALTTAVYAAVTLTIGDVVKMSKAGVSDDVIIQTVQSSGSVFQLTAQDVEALKRSGVSDRVVAVMQAAPGIWHLIIGNKAEQFAKVIMGSGMGTGSDQRN